jgi:hypothetical protein
MPPQPPISSEPAPRNRLKDKFKPASGFSSLLHILYQVALPIVVFVLVRLQIGLWLPVLVIMLSKWRIFAVRPRFWPANLRANSVDIMVGISLVLFMYNSETAGLQIAWAVVYGLWLLFIKPRSSILFVSIQAAIGQLCGLMALFLTQADASLLTLVVVSGLICYLSARHFFDSFNEPYAKMLAYLWGYFGAALLWVLGHMLVVYPKPDGIVAMPTLLLSTIGYSLAAVYYLEHFDRLSTLLRRELLYLGGAIVLILIISLFFEGRGLIV